MRAVLLLGFLGVSGCCSDDAERPPWERPDGAAAPVADGATADGATADGGAPFAVVNGRVDLEGSRASVEIDGLRVTPGGLIRGWLETDLDADGDTDAALLQERPPEEGRTERDLELLTYRREGTELAAAGGETLPSRLGSGCSLAALTLRLAAPGAVALTMTMRCPGAVDGSPADAPSSESVAAVATGPFPLRLRVAARLEGDAATMSMDVADRDRDGAADTVLGLERAGARAEVVWLDRAAGPSIDASATERSLQAALPAPGGRKTLTTRLARVQGVVELRRLLCPEGPEAPSLSALESPGDGAQATPLHLCNASRAMGNAIALLVRGNIELGRLPQARAALSLLSMVGVGLGEERRTALERSIDDHTTLAIETTLEPGPHATVLPAAPGGRAPVRFLDDDRVWVDATPPFIYFVSSRASQPAEPLATPSHPVALDGASPPREQMPEARSGSKRVVGAREGLWIADGAAWAFRSARELGGPWDDVVGLAMSPSGDAIAAVRSGRLEIVRVRRAGAPVPMIAVDGGAGSVRTAGDGGRSEEPTGGPDPSAP